MEYSLFYIPFEISKKPIFLYSIKGQSTFGFLITIIFVPTTPNG